MQKKHGSQIRKAVRTALFLMAFSQTTFMPFSLAQAAENTAQATADYHIKSGALAESLNEFAGLAGVSITLPPSLVDGKTSSEINGSYTIEQAFGAMLAGTGLEAVESAKGVYQLQKKLQKSTVDDVETLSEVAVSATAKSDVTSSQLYVGSQVARAGRAGLMGQRDFMDMPFNTTSYASEMIEDQQARSVIDVLQNDPSVRQTSAKTNINEDFSIRGFTVASQDIALNGMYGLTPYFRVPVEMAERIEVLKGPSALLNGMTPSGSVGGSINIVPKRAGEQPLNRITGNYVSDSIFGGHADLARRFGENNAFGVRLNGMYRKGDTPIDRQDVEEYLGSLALDYTGERLRVTVDVLNQQQKIDGVVRQFTTGSGLTDIPDAPDNELSYPGFGRLTMKDRSVALRGEYDVTDQATVYAGVGRRVSRMDAVAGNPVLTDANGNYASAPMWQIFDVVANSAEAGTKIKFTTGPVKHQLSLGATKLSQNADIHFVAVGAGVSSNLYDPVYINTPSTSGLDDGTVRYSRMTLTSYALADTLSFMDEKLQVTLGARRQNVEQQAYNFFTGQKSGAEYDKSAVTPVAGIVFKPWEHVSVYANYIEGLSQGQVAPVGTSNAGQTFSPYKTKQKEAGVKVDWGKVASTVSLFEIERPSAVTTGGVYRANGEQRNRGLEFNVFGEVASGVRLLGGGAYTQGELVKTQGGAFDGNTAVGVPDWQVSLGGEWDSTAVAGLTLTSRVVYTSKQYVNQANTLSIPSVTRFDVGVRYKTVVSDTPVTLRASLENLFNRDYWNTSNEGYLYLGTPRTLLLSATADF